MNHRTFWIFSRNRNVSWFYIYLFLLLQALAMVCKRFFFCVAHTSNFIYFYLSSACVRLPMVGFLCFFFECGSNSWLSTKRPTNTQFSMEQTVFVCHVIFSFGLKSFLVFFCTLSLSFFLSIFCGSWNKRYFVKISQRKTMSTKRGKQNKKLLTTNGLVFVYDGCNDGKGFV